MRHLRVDLYTGYRDDDRYTEKDKFEQLDNESDEVFVERVIETLEANFEQFRSDEEVEEDE